MEVHTSVFLFSPFFHGLSDLALKQLHLGTIIFVYSIVIHSDVLKEVPSK